MNLETRTQEINAKSQNFDSDGSQSIKSEVSKDSFRKCKKFKPRKRKDNSLGELTKNVVNYIKKNGQKEINISSIVNELKVKKRRIYDITNVLEGIGCIKKIEKNKFKWINDALYDDHEAIMKLHLNKIKNENNSLETEEMKLNNWINDLKTTNESIQEDSKFKEYGYLTYNDIRLLTQGGDMNLIAIRAPSGTSVEIPDPENVHKVYTETNENMRKGIVKYDKDLLDSLEKKYQLFLESLNGEINVYLVLSSKYESNNLGLK